MKKMNFLAAVISMTLVHHAYGAQLTDLDVNSIKNFKSQSAIKNLKQELPVLLGTGVDDQLKERMQSLEADIMHTRYFQTYRGIQVWPQEIAASVKAGQLNTLYGTLVQGLDSDITSIEPRFSADQALEMGKNFFRNSDKNKSAIKANWNYESSKSDLRIFVDSKTQVGRLAYVVSFFTGSSGQPHRPLQVIDAQTGELLKSVERLTTAEVKGTGAGGNLKTGKYMYGKDFPAFAVKQTGTNCAMQTTTTTTIDLKNGTTNSIPFVFKCTENKEKVVNGAYGPLNDAHFYAGVILGLWKDWYKTSPLKVPLVMRVHYSPNGKGYENAFWNGSSMTFGDGASTFYPLVSLDVSSHEIAHGFTEFNSNLDYEKQSGGMNEAFSDMAGEAAEFYAKGKNDFMVGAEIFKVAGEALRYMDNPLKDNIQDPWVGTIGSIDNVKDYFDGLDVHYSSGVYNKAFHILATTKGWTVRKAFDVFVKANQNYWTPTSTFATGAQGVRDAAKDLGYATADIVNAFSKVGIKVAKK